MHYDKIVKGIFLSRPNRFIAQVGIDGQPMTVHVKNTGRCHELLVPGVTVYLAESSNTERKTKYDLVCVEKLRKGKSPLLVNMDSQIPNDAAEEWLRKGRLFSPSADIRREAKYNNSRFDFHIKDGIRRIFLEVKGVTLENEGLASFPDAPTERGVKHIHELEKCLDDGFEAYILFVIQMKEIYELRPNDIMHKAFGDALRHAASKGVNIMAMDCMVTPDTMEIDAPIPVNTSCH